jgi:hypothetical protein
MPQENSLVFELQRLAIDKSNDISDLLRKGLLVAKKLKLKAFEKWVSHELHGYGKDEVPDYRKLRAEIKLRNPFRGLIPAAFEDPELHASLTNISVSDPIGNLIAVVQNSSGFLSYPLSQAEQLFLLNCQDGFGQMPPVRTLGRSQIETIIDVVRTTMLDWACNLEAEGIIGSGLSFSEAERHKAAASTHINIESFQGVLGNIEHSTVTQNLNMDVHKGDVVSLRKYLKSISVEDGDIADLELALKEDPVPSTTQHLGKRVGDWVGKMVGKAASGVWKIGVNIASQLLVTSLRRYYGLPD